MVAGNERPPVSSTPSTSIAQIGQEADKILAGGVTIAAQLDMLGGLIPTRDAIRKIGAGVGQYGAALDKIL